VPTRVFGQSEFRGPLLRDIWVVASAAEAIQLDLKSSATGNLELVFEFLAAQRGGPPVVITTPSVATLRAFAERSPDTLRFFSIDGRSNIAVLERDPELVALIDGIAMREDLADEETVSWFAERDLYVWVWTVNRIERVNELVELGVDGITTDNLAVLELLGGDERGELPMLRPSPPATPMPAEDDGEDEANGGGDEDRPA
jgi:glycerophosphoryl diester phosphodiesterase